ncbi:MAG: AI-2E family transporter [Armatimonadetes bacterium]|nr:AI-2E family transporter [Akkermansiaceae bacterium]
MEEVTEKRRGVERLLGIAALGLLGLLCFFVVRPFASALLWAVILSFTLYPVQRKFTEWFRGSKTWAALAVTLLAVFTLVGPLTLIGISLVDDGKGLAQETKENIMKAPEQVPEWIANLPIAGDDLAAYWEDFISNRKKWAEGADQVAAAKEDEATDIEEDEVEESDGEMPEIATSIVGQGRGDLGSLMDRSLETLRKIAVWLGLVIVKGLTQISISLFLVFFLLRDAARLGECLKVAMGKIAGERGVYLLGVAGKTVKGVVYGVLGTALLQAFVAGVGFLIAGVPGAVLLGALTFFMAVVPVGPPMIWGGASLWLFSQGRPGWGIFMLIWGALGISSLDNVVRPILIGHGNKMPFALIFFGLIGGAVAFGLVGLFLGPTLLAVAFRLLADWTSGKTEEELRREMN